jgi:hypothetical protein
VVEAVTAPLSRLPLIIVALAAIPSASYGHVLDEYLQSTLVAIEPHDIRLKINLTPGVEIAEKVLRQIDQNFDGAISGDESAAYAEMLKRDMTVRLDGRDTQLNVIALSIPDLAELRTGHGIIQMEFAITPCSFSGGNHRLAFENRHFASLGVYLFNAARPQSATIQIARQNRNVNQSRGEIEFVYTVPGAVPLPAAGILAALAVVLVGIATALRRLKMSSTISPGSRPKVRKRLARWT